jgi:hypothetical protein
VDRGAGERPEAFELEQSIYLLAAVGPYLFVRTDVNPYWGGAHPFHEAAFRVLDLRSGEDAELLTAEERTQLTSEEGQWATSRLRQRVGEFLAEGRNPEVTLFVPTYGSGRVVSAEYQFTAPMAYLGSDHQWSAYSCSELVHSQKLPASLHDYKETPHILQRYWAKTPRLDNKVRWTAAYSSPRVRSLLRRLFHDEGTS